MMNPSVQPGANQIVSARRKCQCHDGSSVRFHALLHPWQTPVRLVKFGSLLLPRSKVIAVGKALAHVIFLIQHAQTSSSTDLVNVPKTYSAVIVCARQSKWMVQIPSHGIDTSAVTATTQAMTI